MYNTVSTAVFHTVDACLCGGVGVRPRHSYRLRRVCKGVPLDRERVAVPPGPREGERLLPMRVTEGLDGRRGLGRLHRCVHAPVFVCVCVQCLL